MTESSSATLARVAGAVAAIVRGRLGPHVELGEPQVLKDATRTVVARIALGPGAAPPSVIVKVIRDDAPTGYSEWASLAFLGGLEAARELAPAFIGGDAGLGIFVMEDLGPGLTLEDVLAGGGPGEAMAALGGLARTMARLHAATMGEEQAFTAVRAALPMSDRVGRGREARAWLVGAARLGDWLDAVGLVRPAGLEAALAAVVRTYADPGAWLGFSHGDPAPSNNHIAGGAARLLDFEYGAFRHALYDLSAWEVLCPLPAPAVALMRAAFRAELAQRLPEAGDDATFAEAWAALCAYRGLALLSWVAPGILEADRPMVGDWTAREAVLAAVTRVAMAASGSPKLAPIGAAAARLRSDLAARWPELGPPERLATRWAALAGQAQAGP